MNKTVLMFLLSTMLLAPACQTVKKADISRMPLRFVSREEPSELEKILRRIPNVQWERASRLEEQTNYWVVPGGEPFYLFRDGVQFIGSESALRYALTSQGFDLLTIEKKQGVERHPVCPKWAPILHCIDDHTLLIVTSISCGGTACDYDFIVIDYFSKSPFISNPPAIKEIIDYVLEDRQEGPYFPYHFASRFNEKHRSSGNITSENPLWVDFINKQFGLIQEKINYAVARNEIRILSD